MQRHTVFMNWKTIPIVKMKILPKLIYRLNETPIKILARFFGRYWKAYGKIHLDTGSWNNLDEKNKMGRITLHIKAHSYCNRDSLILAEGWMHRSMEQNPEIDPHKYA